MDTVKIGKYNPHEYTVASRETISGTGSNISLIIGRCDDMYPVKHRPAMVTLSKMTNKSKYTDEDSVGMAKSDDPDRPETLHHVHIDNGVMVAADGFRLHTAPTKKHTCEYCKKNGDNFPQWQQLFPSQFAFEATAPADEMYSAFIRAGVFAREGVNIAKVRANGHFEITGTSEETGQAQTDIDYVSISGSIPGGEMTFGINWKFARDAIKHVAPDGGNVTIKAKSPVSPVVFEANGRQALVMPMKIY